MLITATADSWVEIRNGDGTVLFSQIMREGDSFALPKEAEGATLVTGNAGALTVSVDGVALPPLGPLGAVRRNISLAPEDLRAQIGG